METTALVLLWIFGVDLAGILLTEIVHQIRAWKYSFAGKHVVITGGSSGLGLEMAKQIASESATVTIVARNRTQLEKAKDEITSYCQSKGLMTPLVEIQQADICNKEEIQKAINASSQTNGAVDVIICNAGMAKTGYAFGQTIQDYDDSVRINYMGTVNTLFGVVPSMIQRNHGEIYLVGSTCSMLSYIGYCAYSPSKYAVKGLADGLRMELQRCNIRVGCIYPPNMDTPCLKKENETKPEEGLYVEKHLESLFSPADIARKAIRHIKRGEPQIYCDLDAWAVSMINGSIGPHNNIFVSILFAAPAILFTSAFRWILLGIYRMKQFVGPDRRKKWVAGSTNSEVEDRVFASLLPVGLSHYEQDLNHRRSAHFFTRSHFAVFSVSIEHSYLPRFSFILAMFSRIANRIGRVGAQTTRRLGTALHAQQGNKRALGYAFAIGAFGATSVYLLNNKLSAKEVDGGFLYTWGSGQFGQLGLGTQNDESLPHLVKEIEGEKCIYVTAGANTTAVITEGGRLWTFGQGDSNQLGQGNTEDSPNQVLPCEIEDAFDGQEVVSCSVCDGHMAAVTRDGSVWTWGRGTFGRLGHEVTEAGIPEKVQIEGVKFVKVSAGHVHTLALSEDGTVYAWGNNKTGCVGVESRGTCAPQVVPGLQGKRVIDISAGMESSAALTADHEVFTWGADNYGQLGQGQGPRYVNKPTKIRTFKNVAIKRIACGQYHMLALSMNGDVYAWGQGLQGQTANERKVDTNIPHTIDSLKEYRIVDIAAGGSHSAVVDDKGHVLMFGSGRNGQLGRGDKVESIAAYRVVPTLVEYLQKSRVMQIVCGGDHTAAIVDNKV